MSDAVPPNPLPPSPDFRGSGDAAGSGSPGPVGATGVEPGALPDVEETDLGVPASARARRPAWAKWLIGAVVLVVAVALAGVAIRLPYATLSPGGTLTVQPRISVHGAKSYPDHGPLMLLFVRERDRIDVWRWVQAKLDPNIDLIKEGAITGGQPLEEVEVGDIAAMTGSQLAAKKAALGALGYKVPVGAGALITAVLPSDPAGSVLRAQDVILAVDGDDVKSADQLSAMIGKHAIGTKVTLQILRKGRREDVPVGVVRGDRGRHVIGVFVAPNYAFPVSINIDTSNISGPSAGLAMALAIIDDLTPGDLTGGKRVAVTGTIDPDGNVGPIGGLAQKALSAKAAHAQIFIVPACKKGAPPDQCESDLPIARKRVGKDVKLVPVSTLGEALRALREAGGAPLPAPAGA